jgi:hypothetical protein
MYLLNIAWMFVLGGVRILAERFATYRTAEQLTSAQVNPVAA